MWKDSKSRGGTLNKKWTHLIFLILVAAVSVLVFYKTLRYDFVADDRLLIYNKADYLTDWSNLKTVFASPFPAVTFEPIPFYRPAVTLANFINFHLSGKTTYGYHLVNLAFHVLNVILLYLLIFILFKSELLSLFTALFFAAHPIHTNSVVWISGRTDLIACIFVLLSVIFFIQRKDHTGALRVLLLAGSLLSYLCALFSKEMALALPLFLFIWDYVSEKEAIKKKIVPYIPFLIVTLLYVILRVSVFGNLGTGRSYTSANLFQRFLTIFPIYFYYFKKFIFPVHLNFSPRVLTITSVFSLKFWGSLIFFAVVVALGLSLRKIAKEVSFGIFWILATLVPVLNLVPLYASVKEWWAYIPSIGFCLILGKLAETAVNWEKRLFEIKLPKRKLKEESLSETQVTAPEETAHLQPIEGESSTPPSADFSTEEREVTRAKGIKFPERILIKAGHGLSLFFALLLIFYAFTIQSRARIFRKDYHLWTNTSKIAPYDVVANNAIGDILKRKGVTRWAKMAFQKAVQADSNSAEARNNFGVMLEMTSQDDSAFVQIKAAIRLDPFYADAYNNLGILYGKRMEYDSALVAFKQAFDLDTTDYSACKNLAMIYGAMGNFPPALEYLEKALDLAPTQREKESIQQEIRQIKVRGY
jgi:tetratricopeptide (TPR) repeat protein